MKFADALIAWTPANYESKTAGQIKVGELLRDGQADWTKPYAMTGGAAYAEVRDLKGADATARVFIDYHHIVVRDGLDPRVAHDAFITIDEFAEALAEDIPGARDSSSD